MALSAASIAAAMLAKLQAAFPVPGHPPATATALTALAEGMVDGMATVLTPDGGIGIRLKNATGTGSVRGSVVRASLTADDSFDLEPAGGDDAIGVVYTDGVAGGQYATVVIGGIADVLLQNGETATRGYWVRVSASVAGRAAMEATPNPMTHWTEIGHCIESKASGTNVLARCVLHFN